MAIFGIDQSSRPPPSASALVKAGVKFANHYVADRWTQPVNLDDPSTWPPKCLRPAEVQAYVHAGIAMFTNWETSADAMKAGYDRGQTAASNAAHMAKLCGAPDDMTVYFSADWAATYDEYTGGIRPFLQGAHSKLGRNIASRKRSALYGSVYVVQWAFEDGLIDYGWQTAAWSGSPPIWYPKAQLRQFPDAPHTYHTTIDGVNCDIDHALTADFGQWGVDPPQEDAMSAEDVKAINDHSDGLYRLLARDSSDGRANLAMLNKKIDGLATGLSAVTSRLDTLDQAIQTVVDPAAVAALVAGQLEITGISTDTGGVVTVTFGPKAVS